MKKLSFDQEAVIGGDGFREYKNGYGISYNAGVIAIFNIG